MAASIFERYGGFASVRKVVSDFYDRALASPIIGSYFADIDMRAQIDHQTKFIATIMGGPVSYTNEHLQRLHAPLKIDDVAFVEMSSLLRETLEDHGFEDSDVAEVVAEILQRKPLVVTRHDEPAE